jgi:hypothetical protein
VHHAFVPPGKSVTGHFYLHVLQRLRDAVWCKRCNRRRNSGFCNMKMHQATYRLLCINSLSRKTFLSSSNHRTFRTTLRVNLVVPCSENGPQEDMFRNHGGHLIECEAEPPNDSKRSLPQVFPIMAGSMEQVCVRACACVRACTRNTLISGTFWLSSVYISVWLLINYNIDWISEYLGVMDFFLNITEETRNRGVIYE